MWIFAWIIVCVISIITDEFWRKNHVNDQWGHYLLILLDTVIDLLELVFFMMALMTVIEAPSRMLRAILGVAVLAMVVLQIVLFAKHDQDDKHQKEK